jgi:hypothetical protein
MRTCFHPVALALCIPPALWSGDTKALFELSAPEVGPFPNDSLTVSDTKQVTGHRVNLPQPEECASTPSLSACSNVALLNELDGFSVNPRITFCFSDAVDTSTLASAIWFLAAGKSTSEIPVNQVLYDPVRNCVHAKPERILEQQTQYLLVITDSVQDSRGRPIKPDKNFKDCLKREESFYCQDLARVMDQLEPTVRNTVVSASLFTTLSATTWLERAWQMVNQPSTPLAALPAGMVSVFARASLQSAVWFPQDNNGTNTQQSIPLPLLTEVEKIAFGLFLSPNFLNVTGASAGSITTTPTNEPIQLPVPVPGLPALIPPGYIPVSFHVFVPSISRAPANAQGFPVVIYGHGLGDSQFGAPTFIANTLAANGIATIAFEIAGHGFGPGGFVQLTSRENVPLVVTTPGRGVALSANGPIGAMDGCILPGPLGIRDCARQSAVDLFALVRTIRATNGLGLNLDPNRIYYVGQSFGAMYGTLFHAVEPNVSKAVLNSGGGSVVDVSRLAPSGRLLAALSLGMSNPPLLNVPPAPPQAYFRDAFNDEYVFRNRGVTISTVPGALSIQASFEVAEWLGMPGDPLSFAPHLKTLPLAGVPVKETLFQFGLGDLEVPNPTQAALIRAADGQSSSWFLRFDLAARLHPELLAITMPGSPLPILPHRFLSNPTIVDIPAARWLAEAAQQQIAGYFIGESNTDPNPFLQRTFANVPLFEIPATLPEELGFLQLQP